MLFENYIGYYTIQAFKMKKLVDDGVIDGGSYTRQNIINLQNLKDYLQNAYLTIIESIRSFTGQKLILLIIRTIATIICIAILGYLMWRSKTFQVEQRYLIRKILLSVNDYNCLQCLNYFRKVSNVIRRVLSSMHQNKAKLIEKDLIVNKALNPVF